MSAIVDLDPRRAEYNFQAGSALIGLRQYGRAIHFLGCAVELEPDFPGARLCLAEALKLEQLIPEATAQLRTVIKSDPNSALAHRLLAEVSLIDSNAAGAEEAARRAVELDPADGVLRALLGAVVLTDGRIEEANEHARAALGWSQINEAFPYLDLVTSRKVGPSDLPLVEQIRSVLSTPNLNVVGRDLAEYALAKSLEDLGEFSESMVHYDEANRLAYLTKFGEALFDEKQDYVFYQQIMAGFSNYLSGGNQSPGFASDVPIIVVGMPRSGTTLVHQILSSHPEIGAGGEVIFWPWNWGRCFLNGTATVDSNHLTEPWGRV